MSTSEQLKNAPSDKERLAFDLTGSASKSFYVPNTERYDIVLDSGDAKIKVNGVEKGAVTSGAVSNFSYSGEFTLEADPAAAGHVKSVIG